MTHVLKVNCIKVFLQHDYISSISMLDLVRPVLLMNGKNNVIHLLYLRTYFVEFIKIELSFHLTKTKDYHNPNTRFKYVNNYLQITWVHFVSGRKNSLTYFSLVVLSVVNVRE